MRGLKIVTVLVLATALVALNAAGGTLKPPKPKPPRPHPKPRPACLA